MARRNSAELAGPHAALSRGDRAAIGNLCDPADATKRAGVFFLACCLFGHGSDRSSSFGNRPAGSETATFQLERIGLQSVVFF
jgi:hypothetical protein